MATDGVPWGLDAKAIEEQADVEAEEIEECKVELLSASCDDVKIR